MIRIQGTGDARRASRTKKSADASQPFKPGEASPESASASSAAKAATPAAMMSALIALQSDGGGNAKTLVAAQRTLDLLDELQLRLLNGEASVDDLEALANAAKMRAHAGAVTGLQAVYDEISLRARVELAKLGR